MSYCHGAKNCILSDCQPLDFEPLGCLKQSDKIFLTDHCPGNSVLLDDYSVDHYFFTNILVQAHDLCCNFKHLRN